MATRVRKRPASKNTPAREKDAAPAGERLQKVLAAAGVGSRRQCEELIVEGRVEVDRQVVVELGTKVDPKSQEIRVDGEVLKRSRRHYYLLNKPPGVVSTSSDPEGRPRVVDLIDSRERLFNVGRLDKSSEGLILVTNDGELAHRLTHPRFGVDKTYHVEVAGNPTAEQLATLRRGVHLAEGFAKVKNVRVKKRMPKSALLEIVLDEGRNREIRRVLSRVGHKVLRLKRVAIGPLKLGEIPVGAHRELTENELKKLQRCVDSSGAGSRRPGSRSRPSKKSSGPAKQAGKHRATAKKAIAKKAGVVIDYEPAAADGNQRRRKSKSKTAGRKKPPRKGRS